MLEVAIASRSQPGSRSRNEDNLRFGGGPAAEESRWFAVLADGAGGHMNGAVAADIVVRIAAYELGAAGRSLESGCLRQALARANDALNDQQRGLRSQQRMHATAVSLWLDARTRHALWAHCGDSRLYLLRHGQARQLTRDDSVVQQLIDAGLLAAQEGRHHPRKNHLLAALGMEGGVEIHALEQPFALQDGDAFLLCTDGWWEALEPQDLEYTLAEAGDVEHWLDGMMGLVQQRAQPNQDNYSAIGVWVGDPSQSTQLGSF
jgi:serine/threonine protein phosphatase PrpC